MTDEKHRATVNIYQYLPSQFWCTQYPIPNTQLNEQYSKHLQVTIFTYQTSPHFDHFAAEITSA